MVVDTSVLIAILLQEDGWRQLLELLQRTPTLHLSAASYVEAATVLLRRADHKYPLLSELIADLQIKIQSVDEEQSLLAMEAYRAFGKGRHPAQLNFGDCFSYALAKYLDEPMLFKGNDFSQTDLKRA